MKKILKPKLLIPIVAVLLVLVAVGYILFAPSTMWKPVYIRFENSAAAQEVATEALPTPTTAPAPVAKEQKGAVVPYQPGEGVMFNLGTKIVNLAEPGGRRYLQIGIVLECLPSEESYYALKGEAKTKGEEEELKKLETVKPVIEDAILSLLSSRTYAEIFTIEGKNQLKQEMLSAINGVLGYEKVVAVYFTDFLVQ